MTIFSRQLNVRPGQRLSITIGGVQHKHTCDTQSAKLLIEIADDDPKGGHDQRPRQPTIGEVMAGVLSPATDGMKVRMDPSTRHEPTRKG